MIKPTGTNWWWHLSGVEQCRYEDEVAVLEDLRRQVREQRKYLEMLRRVAENRCRADTEHYHSMAGLIR